MAKHSFIFNIKTVIVLTCKSAFIRTTDVLQYARSSPQTSSSRAVLQSVHTQRCAVRGCSQQGQGPDRAQCLWQERLSETGL